MSNEVLIQNVEILDLNALKKACKDHKLSYHTSTGTRGGQNVVAELYDEDTGKKNWYSNKAYVVETGPKKYGIVTDTHTGYGSIVSRLGKNLGLLKRDYAKHSILDRIGKAGAKLVNQKTKENGSIILRISKVLN